MGLLIGIGIVIGLMILGFILGFIPLAGAVYCGLVGSIGYFISEPVVVLLITGSAWLGSLLAVISSFLFGGDRVLPVNISASAFVMIVYFFLTVSGFVNLTMTIILGILATCFVAGSTLLFVWNRENIRGTIPCGCMTVMGHRICVGNLDRCDR